MRSLVVNLIVYVDQSIPVVLSEEERGIDWELACEALRDYTLVDPRVRPYRTGDSSLTMASSPVVEVGATRRCGAGGGTSSPDSTT